jgi:outer membrane protein OmpA-like peptidoglycan-associated protein
MFANLTRALPVLGLAALLLALPARADDVSLVVENQTFAPGRKPTLILKINKAVASAHIKVSTKGARINRGLGAAKRGGELRVALPHKGYGILTWQGQLDVNFVDGSTGSMPLQFQTKAVRTFKYKLVSPEEEIRKENKIRIVSEVPCSKIEVAVYGDYGKLLANEMKEFPNVPAGTELEVKWDKRFDGDPLHLQIEVYDDHGFHRKLDSFPYRIDIEHEDVEFESGKHDVMESQSHKLVDAVGPINDAARRYGKAVELDDRQIVLFITGHTDTVGGSAYNRGLSFRRARSIGKWLKKAGVTVPIYIRGVGESDLKVATDDNVEEAKNRRAEYQVLVTTSGERGGFTRVK